MREHIDTAKAFFAGLLPWLLSPEHFDLTLRIIASAGAAFYIWRKIIRNKD